MSEREYALREALVISLADEYFDARPNIDTKDMRRVFEAAASRMYDKRTPKKPLGLTDQEISNIALNMPGGTDGFMKGWGWQQFARAIEEAHGIPFDEETP